eukprot:5830504-Lingulodinium_polyedra.AAC.1
MSSHAGSITCNVHHLHAPIGWAICKKKTRTGKHACSLTPLPRPAPVEQLGQLRSTTSNTD